jgi:hypothetical protein
MSQPKADPWFAQMLLNADAVPLEVDAVDIMAEFYIEQSVWKTSASEAKLQAIFEKRFGLDGWDRIKNQGSARASSRIRGAFN